MIGFSAVFNDVDPDNRFGTTQNNFPILTADDRDIQGTTRTRDRSCLLLFKYFAAQKPNAEVVIESFLYAKRQPAAGRSAAAFGLSINQGP